MEIEYVVLVDENDTEIGQEEKLKAHQLGLLHRAFSIILFNNKGEILLQQRALTKYHSRGLWTNTCCSHPRPNETLTLALQRRLEEELLIDSPIALSPIAQFLYKVELEDGLMEHELDHIFVGQFNQLPTINSEEAMAYRFIAMESLIQEIKEQPDAFTFWFKEIIAQFCQKIQQKIDESL